MKIKHVSNASRLWASIIEYSTDFKTSIPFMDHDLILIKNISYKLAEFYSNCDNRKYHGMLKVPGNLLFFIINLL